MTDEVNIAALPSLPLTDRAQLPECAAVYFAIAPDDQILYIGRSLSLASRWKGHHRAEQLSEMQGVRIVWLSIDEPSLLPEIERALIDRFEPSLNRSPVPTFDGNVPRQVRMPPILDEWLRVKAEASAGAKSIADVVREIVADARERELAA